MKRSRFIRWALLCVVLAIIIAGACFIAMDYDKPTWRVLAAAVCFGAGLSLGHYLENHNLLPE